MPDTEDQRNQRLGPIFKYGLLIGILLILVGGISMNWGLTNFVVEVFVICSGLGIILGAFGSTAKIDLPGQGAILVGVAALAVVVFTLIFNRIDSQYLILKIDGDVYGNEFELVGDRGHLGAYQSDSKSFNFAIFGPNMQATRLKLYISHSDTTAVMFECIPTSAVRPFLASGRTIEWKYQRKLGRVVNAEGTSLNDVNCDSAVDVATVDEGRWSFSFFPKAYAQTQTPIPTNEPSVKQLIEGLDSNAGYVRRDARSLLAERGPEAIGPLVNVLTSSDPSYRGRLGAIVAFSKMARDEKQSKLIATGLGEAGLVAVAKATADPDRTIRVHASELLIRLADPHVIPIAVSQMAEASRDGRYNLALVINATAEKAPPLDSDTLSRLAALKKDDSDKTNALIDEITTNAEKME